MTDQLDRPRTQLSLSLWNVIREGTFSLGQGRPPWMMWLCVCVMLSLALQKLLDFVLPLDHSLGAKDPAFWIQDFMLLGVEIVLLSIVAVLLYHQVLGGISNPSLPSWSQWGLWAIQHTVRMTQLYLLGMLTLLVSTLLVGFTGLFLLRIAMGKAGFDALLNSLVTSAIYELWILLFTGVFSLLTYYVIGRCCLILPAIVSQTHETIATSWEKTSGHGWRISLLFSGILVVEIVLADWIGHVVTPEILEKETWATSLINTGLSLFVQSWQLAMTPIIFRELSINTPPTNPQQATL